MTVSAFYGFKDFNYFSRHYCQTLRREQSWKTCQSQILQSTNSPRWKVMVSGSMSNLANAVISSGVSSFGSVLSIPSFLKVFEKIAECLLILWIFYYVPDSFIKLCVSSCFSFDLIMGQLPLSLSEALLNHFLKLSSIQKRKQKKEKPWRLSLCRKCLGFLKLITHRFNLAAYIILTKRKRKKYQPSIQICQSKTRTCS